MNQYSVDKSRVQSFIPSSFASVLILMVTCGLFGQANDTSGRNNPFSPSPPRKVKSEVPVPTPSKSGPREISFIMQSGQEAPPSQEDRPTIAQRTFNIAKQADLTAMPPTDVYKVGVGDVLLVTLKNAGQGSGYYTVRHDGTMDFPLAGEKVIVIDQPVEDIEEILSSGITIFPNAQVEVKVREYASHKITVSGMVERPGERSLQREAMPLFAIRAEAGVDGKATKALVTRSPQQNRETYVLSDAKTDNVLIYPGNAVEFTSDAGRTGAGHYFVSGDIMSAGQRDFSEGITLYQAVIAAGGPKGDPKKAFIRRKNYGGILVSFEHNLRAIKGGKAQDPTLLPGDIVDVRN